MQPHETPVAEMKRRADQRIPYTMYGGEGWAQLVPRPTSVFPEKVKEFLRDKFEEGEMSASDKVSLSHARFMNCSILLFMETLFKVTPLECESLLRAHFPEEDCWLRDIRDC